MVYIPFNDKERIKKIVETIKNFFPNISIIGCSVPWIIYNSKINDNLILVSLLFFEKSFAKVVYFEGKDFSKVESS